MRYKFTKNISCDKPHECVKGITKKIKTLFGENMAGINYHISIFHENSNHVFWIFLYDNTGIHESENTITKEIKKQKSDKIKKFKGTKPSETEIKNALK